MGLSVGYRPIEAADPVMGAMIPVRLFYPALAPERRERLGPYGVDVAPDAPPLEQAQSLAVISHGNGGSSLTHRGLAAHLARAGFVVALVDHPGNRRNDNALAFTAANLENRPRHIRLALDAIFADPALGGRLRPAVGMIGHSIGAYTALAVAGGRPAALPIETPDGQAWAVPVTPDPRVRALVLMAPAAIWFMAEAALSDVIAPILILTGEQDQIAPPLHARIVRDGVADPARVEHRVVAGAGHFAFQTPFPAEMTRPDFPPSQDPPGFDRAAYQPILHAEVEAFLRRGL